MPETNEGLPKNSKLVVVSNRLPFEIKKEGEALKIIPGSGGLITALAPILKNRGGKWIGWPGLIPEKEENISQFIENISSKDFSYYPVYLTERQVEHFYQGFSNEILWPLFHDLQVLCHFKPEYWEAYKEMNEKFSKTVMSSLSKDDFIWVHDYHLMLVGDYLKKHNVKSKIGFFLHIPFPSVDIFLKLPWRKQLLNSLLQFDLIGFQTQRDRRNFIQCVRALHPDIMTINKKTFHLCKVEDREVKVGAFPISIDFKDFATKAKDETVSKAAWLLHENFTEQKIVFSLDRLDYTKGILQRLQGIHIFLKLHPEYHKKVTFIQVVIASRVNVPKYQNLKQEIDRLVSEINSEFTKDSWVPINYLFKSISKTELYAYYRTAEVALITPIKDGMNLVAKEYVACNAELNGTLILSEFAGAASQMQIGAILVNPYDVEGIAEAIFSALKMTKDEKVSRMKALRKNGRRYDIYWWTKVYLHTAFGLELHDFNNP